MKTYNQLQKHQKAMKIIALLENLDQRINSHLKSLSFRYNDAHYRNRLKIDCDIKARLSNYYNSKFKL